MLHFSYMKFKLSAIKDHSTKGFLPIPVAARSEAWVCGRLPAGIVGSNPAEGMDVCLL
jgi:hypothetical protein